LQIWATGGKIDGVASVTLQSSTATSTPGGGSGGAAGCPPHAPAYVLQVTFQPLPSSAVISSAAKPTTVAETGASR